MHAQKCQRTLRTVFLTFLGLGILCHEVVTTSESCAVENAGAPGFVWFQQRAEWECISANKPVNSLPGELNPKCVSVSALTLPLLFLNS